LKNGARSLGNVAWVAVSAAGLLLLVTSVMIETSLINIVAPILGRDATLTGRTDLIWSELIPISLRNPFFGVGYGAFWIRPIFEFPINQAHNGYLDVFIELGWVGLILLTILIVSFFKKAKEEFELDPDWACLRLAFLLMILLHNITETSFLRSTILMWNMLVFLMVVYSPIKFKKNVRQGV
jgi:exopolysaccharide production protein ExoQ